MFPIATPNPPARTDVLIVDGDPTAAQQLKAALERDGMVTKVATDGEAAVQAVRQDRPAAVVVDPLHLPEGGVQVLGRLRALHADLPILCFCELRPSVERTLSQSGAGQVIAKGDLDTLLVILGQTTGQVTAKERPR